MKQKLLLILGLFLVFTAVPVLSQDDVEALDNTTPISIDEVKVPTQSSQEVKPLVLPPKWTDFCETGYENAVYTNRDDIFNARRNPDYREAVLPAARRLLARKPDMLRPDKKRPYIGAALLL